MVCHLRARERFFETKALRSAIVHCIFMEKYNELPFYCSFLTEFITDHSPLGKLEPTKVKQNWENVTQKYKAS